VRSFSCHRCHGLVFFENTSCLNCNARLGFSADVGDMLTLAPVPTSVPDGQVFEVIAGPGDHQPWRRCANVGIAACNWVVPADGHALRCASCALTRTRPADGDSEAMAALAIAERAKRRLVFQLFELGLPIVDRAQDPDEGLAFDLLSSRTGKITTGHADGVITLDLAESDDAHREAMRHHLQEPYRTLLGHFRHEIGHYYWSVLVQHSGRLDACRDLFGDDRADYARSLDRHYHDGPPADWKRSYVSAYATMHPWEDWAETFAHILHIRDTIQSAAAFGMVVAGPLDQDGRRDPERVAVPMPEAVGEHAFDSLISTWLPLTTALNAVNRSMGNDDLYPFVLAPRVIEKLAFVHQAIVAAAPAAGSAPGGSTAVA
jgi:hypothetical protein